MDFSFDGLKLVLQKRLSALSEWATTLYYSTYDRIIDIIAYCNRKLCYEAEFLYKESALKTATLRSSITDQAYTLGYTPYRKKGAYGTLSLSGSSTFSSSYVWDGNNITIARWKKFSNKNKSVNVYCTTSTVYYSGIVGSLSISVKEGVPKSYTYIAKGDVNEEIYLYSTKIDNDELDVYITDSNGNILYTVDIVEDLNLIDDEDNYYCMLENSSTFDNIKFTFGDGISSKKLENGTYVLFKYAETSGLTGDINNASIINTINDTLYDTDGNLISSLYVTNTDAITGGSDYEDTTDIKSNARNLFASGYRCCTTSDWESIVISYPFVVQCKAWTVVDEGGSTLASDQNQVYITALNSDGYTLTADQKLELTTDLTDNYKSPTEQITYVDIEKVYASFTCNVTISGCTTATIQANIKVALYDAYKSTASSFYKKIYQSDFVKKISALDYVVYHETSIRAMDYNIGYSEINKTFSTYYVNSDNTESVLVVPDTPQLWIKRKIGGIWQTPVEIAYSSGSVFVPLSGWTLSSNSISYTNYTYSYVIDTIINDPTTYGTNDPDDDTDLGYIICLLYQTQDGDGNQVQTLRLQSRNQITDIDTSFIFVTATEED